MKDKKTILLLLVGILLGVTIMGGVVCFAVSKVKLVDKTYAAKVNNSNEEATKSTKEVPVYEYYESKVEESKKENQTPKANTNTSTKSNTTKTQINKTTKSTKTETIKNTVTKTPVKVDNASATVVRYIENDEKNVFTDANIEEFNAKVKAEIIKITDFVFNGTEINGHTFDELTEQAKLYVMDLLVKIDAKIEEVHPGYKDEIKIKVKDYTDRITDKYYEITEKICTEMGTTACNQAKKDVETMKENFNLTLDLAKVIGKSTIESIKEWYEIFKSTN
ncbi:MAG: hypothetical protein SPI91_00260 [Bacilli bacterium]|nr:hypothetical protein [Bacilli bacterium]